MTTPKIVIVDMGLPSERTIGTHGRFSEWFARVIVRLCDTVLLESIAVARATEGDLRDAAGIILTGAREGVYDRLPWRADFDPLLRSRIEDGQPILGVCFAHQYLAELLGGKVAYAPDHAEEGLIGCQLTEEGLRDPLFAGLPERPAFLASHHDMVVELPPGAVLLAGNGSVPVEAFHLAGTNARGVQFHPEMTRAISQTLIEESGFPQRTAMPSDTEQAGPGLLANFLGICGVHVERG